MPHRAVVDIGFRRGLVDVSKDGRLSVDGMLTHQGEAPAAAESDIYDCPVWHVPM